MNIMATKEPQSVGSASSGGSEFLARARGLAELLEGEAAAVEANKTLTPAVVEALSDSGLFWMFVPREQGGGGCGFVDLLEVIEEITRADGSIGWSFMANSGSAAICATMLGDSAIDAMFGGSKLPLIGGMLGPAGKAKAVDGGFVAAGKFAFGSGSGHANWIAGGMVVMDGDKPHLLPSGAPEIRCCMVPRSKVELLGNWNVTGMIGTGSYDFQILEQFVPRDFTFERSSLEPQRGGARFSGGMQAIGSLGHAGVALGLMKRGLEEIARLSATKKRPAQTRVVGDSEQFRYEFGMNEANYQAARELTYKVFRDIDEAGNSGVPIGPEVRAQHRLVTTWLHKVGDDVVRFCHHWAGSDAVRAHTPMSRLSRDMSVATQHAWVDPATVTDNSPLETWRKH